MNAANPFQIPPCLQRADLQQRRRQRFRNGFMAALAAHVVLFAVLLIQGCKTGQTAFTTNLDVAPPTENVQTPEISQNVQATPAVPAAPVASVSQSQPAAKPVITVPAAASEVVYQVKPGDTLSRIAKTHNCTVSALKAANGMSDDRIIVGAKLKIPTA